LRHGVGSEAAQRAAGDQVTLKAAGGLARSRRSLWVNGGNGYYHATQERRETA
jgi:hypothetical protein